MSEEILEPSEIIIEKNGTIKEQISHVNPWIRFLARFFDYSLFILALSSVRYCFTGSVSLDEYKSFIPIPFFSWIVVEAFLLSTWGTTPGKFFLKTKISSRRFAKLDFMSALRRSFNVWFRGIGMGIPVINFLCLMVAYNRLKLLGSTTWDMDDQTIITHYPIGQWRIVLATAVTFCGFLFYYIN